MAWEQNGGVWIKRGGEGGVEQWRFEVDIEKSRAKQVVGGETEGWMWRALLRELLLVQSRVQLRISLTATLPPPPPLSLICSQTKGGRIMRFSRRDPDHR